MFGAKLYCDTWSKLHVELGIDDRYLSILEVDMSIAITVSTFLHQIRISTINFSSEMLEAKCEFNFKIKEVRSIFNELILNE